MRERMLIGLLAAVLVILAQGAAADEELDEELANEKLLNCQPYTDENIKQYLCPDDTTVSLFDNDNKTVIECNGNHLNCSQLEHFSYKGSKTQVKLSVSNCNFNSSAHCVLDLLNATGLNTLFIRNTHLPVTEETVRGLDMMQNLFIYEVNQKTIPLEVLKTLPKLKMVRLSQDDITAIPSNIFQHSGLAELQTLEISLNDIKSIPEDAFRGLTALKTLNIFKNKFQEADVNAFRGLDSLEELSLSGSEFSALPAGVFERTPRLRLLSFNANLRDLRVTEGVFSGLDSLEELYLSSNQELFLGNASLSNLPSLKNLMLQQAGIRALPADLLYKTTALVSLLLNNNNLTDLPESVFSGLAQLQTLDLSSNRLVILKESTFENLMQLRELRLDRNLIETVPEHMFFMLPHLSIVSVSYNRIRDIGKQAFSNQVTDLNLSHNNINWTCLSERQLILDDNMSYNSRLDLPSPLNNLDYLKQLDLSHNSISKVCYDWLSLMIYLDNLNLSHNRITELRSPDINFLSNNVVVDLRDNLITRIDAPDPSTSRPKKLLMGGNPYLCDCYMYQFLQQLEGLYDLTNANCKLPDTLRGVALTTIASAPLASSVSLSNLTCPLIDTPDDCSCLVRPAFNRTECNCLRTNGTLPIPTHNGHSIKTMHLTLKSIVNISSIPSFVPYLNLSYLGLTSIPSGIPPTVAYVDFTNNSIKEVPSKFLQRNIKVWLGNNNIECECDNTDNVKTIQKYKAKIEDYNMLLCSDDVYVWQKDALRLCDATRITTISVSLALTFVIIIVCVSLGYKYSEEITVFVINKGCISKKYLDADKAYDVFLSYDHADERLVMEQIYPKLLKDYTVCNHLIDWVIGEEILTQIKYSVSQSRRTVVVLSNACLPRPGKTTWVLEEIRIAVMQALQDKQRRVVIVMLDDFKSDNAPEFIRNYVKMNTYIKWGEPLFWDKLRYALPRKMKVEDIKRKKINKQAKNLGLTNHGLNVVVNEDGKLVNANNLKNNSPHINDVIMVNDLEKGPKFYHNPMDKLAIESDLKKNLQPNGQLAITPEIDKDPQRLNDKFVKTSELGKEPRRIDGELVITPDVEKDPSDVE